MLLLWFCLLCCLFGTCTQVGKHAQAYPRTTMATLMSAHLLQRSTHHHDTTAYTHNPRCTQPHTKHVIPAVGVWGQVNTLSYCLFLHSTGKQVHGIRGGAIIPLPMCTHSIPGWIVSCMLSCTYVRGIKTMFLILDKVAADGRDMKIMFLICRHGCCAKSSDITCIKEPAYKKPPHTHHPHILGIRCRAGSHVDLDHFLQGGVEEHAAMGACLEGLLDSQGGCGCNCCCEKATPDLRCVEGYCVWRDTLCISVLLYYTCVVNNTHMQTMVETMGGCVLTGIPSFLYML